MKKRLAVALLALLVAILTAAAAFAQPGPPPGQHPGGPGPGPVRPGPPPPPNPGYRPGFRPVGPPPPPPSPGYRPGFRPVGPPPPPPPRYSGGYNRGWYGDWNGGWYNDGFGVGILLGAIMSSQAQADAAAAAAQQQAYENKVAQIRSSAEETATRQSSHLAQLISQAGPDNALADLNAYWQAQGQTTFLDARSPISTLRATGFPQNMTIVYLLDRNIKNITVTVNAREYGVSQSSSVPYTLPLPTLSKDAQRLLGFSLADSLRSPDGFFLIQDVIPGTAAAYAGIKNGAKLYKIDGWTTATVTAAQLNAYIESRAAQNGTAAITFSGAGGQKTVQIKL